jgi:hypothetical protein
LQVWAAPARRREVGRSCFERGRERSGRAKFAVNPPHSDIWCELSHTSGSRSRKLAPWCSWISATHVAVGRRRMDLPRCLTLIKASFPKRVRCTQLLRLGTPQFSSKAYIAGTARGFSTYDPASHHNCTLAISPAELGGNRRSRT